MSIVWLAESSLSRAGRVRVGRSGRYYIAEWGKIARLSVCEDGSAASFTPLPGADPTLVDKVETGVVPVLVGTLRGQLGLHGACVGDGADAIAFLGDSTSGKSTLAAAFGQLGFSLLADDAIAVKPQGTMWQVLPHETRHFVDRAALLALELAAPQQASTPNGKASIPALKGTPSPLRAIISLAFDDALTTGPGLRPVAPVEAMGVLVRQAIRLALDDARRLRTEMDHLTDLCTSVPAFELRRPRDLGRLVESVRVVSTLWRGR